MTFINQQFTDVSVLKAFLEMRPDLAFGPHAIERHNATVSLDTPSSSVSGNRVLSVSLDYVLSPVEFEELMKTLKSAGTS